MEVAELKVFFGSYKDRTARVRHPEDKVREARLRGLGHIGRRDGGYTDGRLWETELSGRRKRGRGRGDLWMW